jgi:hypothetical protein
MSDVEYECRYEIAVAYACYTIQHGPWPCSYEAYMRALGCSYHEPLAGRGGGMLKGPLSLQDWGAFCAYCKHPIVQGEQAFLDEQDEEPDVYVHQACITAYVKELEEEG